MTSPHLRSGILSMGLAFLAVSGWAQAPSAPPSPEGSPKPDTIKAILDQELQPAVGGYSYNPQGRRDPFVSLIKPVGPDQGPKTRKPGMEGLLIQEVALKGIVKTPEGFIAMFLGTDGKSYFPRLRQKLFDGEIIAIDPSTVTFRQEIADPLSPVRTREVKKFLYPSEEARQ